MRILISTTSRRRGTHWYLWSRGVGGGLWQPGQPGVLYRTWEGAFAAAMDALREEHGSVRASWVRGDPYSYWGAEYECTPEAIPVA